MAKVGLSQCFYAVYTYTSGTDTVSYSNGGTLAKAVEVNIELENAESVKFYANNGVAESASNFSSGTMTLTVDSLPLDNLAAIMGLQTQTVTTPSGKSLSFPSTLTPPYLGYGTVAKMVVGNTQVFRALLLYKVQFEIPTDAFSTQGETIEFSGHELSAAIMRSDDTSSNWKTYADFTTEANAIAWLKAQLSIT